MLDLLNPCQNDNAWWQHLLMLGVPFLLGLLWAKGSTNNNDDDDDFSDRLSSLDAELANCRNLTRTSEASLTATAEIANIGNSLSANELISSSGLMSSKTRKDDLKVVEGIGPKIEELFNNAGILSFDDLANTSSSRLKEILEAAGSRFQMHDPTTWPLQSKLAAEGKWEDLKKWQDELNKGNA